jgi:hypothetical protein
MSMDVDVIKEGIDSLIRAGYYKDKEKLLDEAFRTMLEVRPALKTEMAIELYKELIFTPLHFPFLSSCHA